MKVNTKLNVGDKAYIMSKNKVHEIKIEEMIIRISKSAIAIIYIINMDVSGELFQARYSESEIFETKQQLLVSL